jgi:hypothetical protein
MNTCSYSVVGRWSADAETPAVIGAKFLDTLDQLTPLAPVTRNWLFADQTTAKPIPMAKAAPDIATLIRRGVGKDDEGVDKRLGYRVFARGGDVESQFGTPRSVDVEVTSGSIWDNQVKFAIGGLSDPFDPELVTYSIYKSAFDILGSIWPCPWLEAHLFASSPSSLIGRSQSSPRTDTVFPWILYLSAPLAAGCPIPTELIRDPTPGGGVILSATQDRLDRDNPEHIRRSRMLQTIIAERIDSHRPPTGGGLDLPARMGPF